jgi:hypothetical protein
MDSQQRDGFHIGRDEKKTEKKTIDRSANSEEVQLIYNDEYMNLKLRPNLKLVIFALFMGILFGLNHIIGLIFRNGYSPFNVTDIWELDQIYYATRMHYVSLTGHISSIYSFSDAIPILFFGFMNKFISIDKIFMIAPFIFIPILVYMIYLFEKELGISGEYAILGTVSVICLQAAAIIP